MYAVRLAGDAGTEAFKLVARRALALKLSPQALHFAGKAETTLFPLLPEMEADAFTVPRAFAALMERALCHRAEDRFALLYDVLWRIKHGSPDLASRAADPAVARLNLYAKAIGRDIHKMHAFVRFHEKQDEKGKVYIAWFEPHHFILKAAAPFFRNRFASMRWLIATPIGTVEWDGKAMRFGRAIPKPPGLGDDVLDSLWKTYYRTTFNPARIRLKAMKKEMPKSYWHNMPETADIPALLAEAPARVTAMDRAPDIAPRFAAHVIRDRSEALPALPLDQLRLDAKSCTSCPLHGPATQVVFGEGPENARLMLVGEQPGDKEDLMGVPFIGPAGNMLDRALAEAGIVRSEAYVTNAVKHFKYQPRGKLRLHMKPTRADVRACSGLLRREIETIKPELIVALGSTAALSLSREALSISAVRGQMLAWPDGRAGVVTVHPSYLLRLQDKRAAEDEYRRFVEDLKLAADFLAAKKAA